MREHPTPTNAWQRATLATVALALAIALVACGEGDTIGGGSSEEVQVAEASGDPEGELTISNWSLYIDEKTIPEFESETGIAVDYVEDINSYNQFFGKMQPLLDEGESGGRSLMVANDVLAERMYELGYLQKLDKEALAPAFENLSDEIKPPSNDPNWEYTIPWQGGITGLIVNTEEAPDFDSVSDFFDPKYRGRVEMITELQEAVPLVMKSEGIDPADATEEDWLAAIDKIDQAADSGQIRRFTGGDYAKDLANGDAVAVMGWAADAIQLQADNPELEWRMPAEGCMVWWDNWVVPVGAPNPTAAYEWINYTYEPEHQAQIVGWTSAVTPGAGVQEILEKTDPEAASSELIFPSANYTEDCSTPVNPPGDAEARQRVEQAWAEVIGG